MPCTSRSKSVGRHADRRRGPSHVTTAIATIAEVSAAEARARLSVNPKAVLMDVREDSEWQQQHAANAVHLGKGILERDLENL